jgi:hypothetical protein
MTQSPSIAEGESIPDELRPDLVYVMADAVDKMLGTGAELERSDLGLTRSHSRQSSMVSNTWSLKSCAPHEASQFASGSTNTVRTHFLTPSVNCSILALPARAAAVIALDRLQQIPSSIRLAKTLATERLLSIYVNQHLVDRKLARILFKPYYSCFEQFEVPKSDHRPITPAEQGS